MIGYTKGAASFDQLTLVLERKEAALNCSFVSESASNLFSSASHDPEQLGKIELSRLLYTDLT